MAGEENASANIRKGWVSFGDYFRNGRLVIHFYIYTLSPPQRLT
jgi:hypothetical protein